MASYHVDMWITQEQEADTGHSVLFRAVDYIEESTKHISDTITATGKTDTYIDAPTEDPWAEFTAMVPCGYWSETFYNLGAWWKYRCGRCGLDDGADCNLLITDLEGEDGRGIAHQDLWACANGDNIENLDYNLDYYNQDGAKQLGILLQEVGHCFLDGTIADDDGDGHTEHDLGDNYYHDGSQHVSPMSVGYWDELDNYNECGDYFVEPDGKHYVEFNFDDCVGWFI